MSAQNEWNKSHRVVLREASRRYRRSHRKEIDGIAKFRRRRLRAKLVEYKGGKCSRCGYSEYVGSLDFHHTDPSSKSFQLSSCNMGLSWKRILEEANKCVLLCKNCHYMITHT